MKFGMEEILAIVDKVKSTELSLFEYQDADIKIKIKGTKAAPEFLAESGSNGLAAAPHADLQEDSYSYIESPMVGTFYAAPSENDEPFVQVGDAVKKGQTVGIVEAMKLMNEIEADCEGIVEEILVGNESLVEYGQPLIRVRTANGLKTT